MKLNELKQKSWQNSIKISLVYTWKMKEKKSFQAHLKLSEGAYLGKNLETTIYSAVYCGYLTFLQVIPSAGKFVSHRK